MTSLYLERKELLPERFYTLKILEAKTVHGEYEGESTHDLLTKLKVAGGEHASAEFSDYAKLSGKGGVKENSKAQQIIEAAMRTKMEDLGRFEPEDLVVRQFMARVGSSKNGKRNLVVYDAIGPAQTTETDVKANGEAKAEAPRAGEKDDSEEDSGNIPL